MKSIRDRLAVLLMLCLLVWGAVPALAAETVDETRIGSIKDCSVIPKPQHRCRAVS